MRAFFHARLLVPVLNLCQMTVLDVLQRQPMQSFDTCCLPATLFILTDLSFPQLVKSLRGCDDHLNKNRENLHVRYISTLTKAEIESIDATFEW